MEDLPSSHPLYNLSMSETEIRNIISSTLPGCKLISFTEFPRDSSFNNKLYDVVAEIPQIEHRNFSLVHPLEDDSAISGSSNIRKHMILRLCGRFWKHYKIINEVACLQLLRRAGGVPVPEVLGYHAAGNPELSDMTITSPAAENETETANIIEKEWILMEKLPGSSLSSEIEKEQLSAEDEHRIARQLASILKVFRHGVKRVDGKLGNLRAFRADGSVEFGPYIDGLHADGWPWNSYYEYTKALLTDALYSLENKPILAPNQGLATSVKKFLEDKLQSLLVFSDDEFGRSVFTHVDFSPRNILVHRDSTTGLLNVSGIVDFEFAGFFPFHAEFAASEGEAFDTKKDGMMHTMLLEEMEELGIDTKRTVDEESWIQAELLGNLRTNIAPWWLLAKDEATEGLEDQLEEARNEVEFILEKLEKY